jgi:hypothetical protein
VPEVEQLLHPGPALGTMPANPVVRGATEGPLTTTAVTDDGVPPDRMNPNLLDPDGVKISAMVAPNPGDDELAHLLQMGVTHCYAWVPDEMCTASELVKLRERVNSRSLTLWNAGCMRWSKNADIILGTERRWEAIEGFKGMLRSLAAAQIYITTFTWEPDGVWSTVEAVTRGGGTARSADANLLAGHSAENPSRHGREFSLGEPRIAQNNKPYGRRVGMSLA